MSRSVRTLSLAALAVGLAALIAGAIGAKTAPGAQAAPAAPGQPVPLSFATERDIALGHSTGAMVAGKFNGGPRADLAILNDTPVHSRSGTLSIVRDVNGHFRLVRTVVMRSFTSSLAAGDVNRDGRLDLVLSTPESWLYSQPSMSVLLGAGNATFGAPRLFKLSTAEPMVLADLNGDHHLDVVTTAHEWVVVLLGRGDGTFKARHSYLGDAGLDFGYGAVGPLVVGDVNGDGKLDVVAGGVEGANSPVGTLNVLLGNGRGGLDKVATTITGQLLPGGMALSDVSGDGKLDLVVNYGFADSDVPTPPAAIVVSNGNGDGTFTPMHEYDLPEVSTGALTLRDMNGDGIRDAVVELDTSFDVLPGDGAGGIEAPIAFPHAHWAGGVGMAVADYNGDGKPDIALKRPRTLSIFLNTTTVPAP